MLSIRKVKTKSGSTAIQVVLYKGHRSKIIKHIGSGKNKDELSLLYQKARAFIKEYTGETSLFPEEEPEVLFVDQGECISVMHHFARRFLLNCAKEFGFVSDIDNLLLDLSIMRLIEPASKIRTIKLLSEYFGVNYSQRVYRKIPQFVELKSDIERKAYNAVQYN